MRKFLTKYSAAGTFETVDHFCHTSSRVRCDKQMYVVWHHFHSLDEHAVLLCRGIQNVLEPLFHFTDKNFAAILRAEHDVVRQVEDGSGVLDVTTVFWRLKSYVISLPCSYLFFKYLYALTCRLKSAVRRAVTYRNSSLDAPNSLRNRCLLSWTSSRFLRTNFASSAAARNSGCRSMSPEVMTALARRQRQFSNSVIRVTTSGADVCALT